MKVCLATSNKNSDSKHQNIQGNCCFIQQEALRYSVNDVMGILFIFLVGILSEVALCSQACLMPAEWLQWFQASRLVISSHEKISLSYKSLEELPPYLTS